MFKNIVTWYLTSKYFKYHTAAVKQLDFLNGKNIKSHWGKAMINMHH